MDREKILNEFDFLSKNDKNQKTLYGFKTYGANRHNFKLNPPLPIAEVRKFEYLHGIELPLDYLDFITSIGNGGAGPGNGLHPLEKWNYDLDSPDIDFLKIPFPHEEPWNIKYQFHGQENDEEYSKFEREYYDNKQVTGAIRISDYGCGINYMLVVTGSQKGNIWIDDRCSEYGIYNLISNELKKPFTFEIWYMDWLENSIKALKEK